LNFELFLYGSSNFFPRKLLKKVFGLPSAPLPPAIRRVELRPKTWNFSILLKRKNGARNPSAGGKKCGKISGFGVPRIRNGGKRKRKVGN